MKNFKELTREEILSLSREQVNKYIQKEWIESNIPLDILSKEKNVEPEPELPKHEAVMYGISGLDIMFDSQEKAIRVMDVMIENDCKGQRYPSFSHSGYSDGRIADEKSLYIKSILTYTDKQVREYNELHKEWKKRNELLKTVDYNSEMVEWAEAIADKIKDEVNKIRAEYIHNMKMYSTFQTYMELSDENVAKSIDKMQLAYPFNDWTEEFLISKWKEEHKEETTEE